MRRTLGHRLRSVSSAGILVGSVLFAASLTPSLVPRDALLQGAIGGATFSVGYAIGWMFTAAWQWLGLAAPGPRFAARARIAAVIAAVAIAAAPLMHVAEWQNSIRVLMGMPPIESADVVTLVLVAAATAAVLFAVAWLFTLVVRVAAAWLLRVAPPRVAAGGAVLAAVILFAMVVDGVILRAALDALDLSYQALDDVIEPDTAPPPDPSQTGSAASLVDWHDLGRAGRLFVGQRPDAATIAALGGGPAMTPLRVYVGLNAADTPDERAALALAELKRVGAFGRKVLVVAVPTGTGFMDPAAVDTLEVLHRGDVATVAMQYSYLQSWVSLLVEPGTGSETSRALFRAVYGHWTTLPDDARPRLYLYGLSLGALSSEQSFEFYEIVGDPFHGALWSGPPFPSPGWRAATAARVPGSPAWLPRVGNGSILRFTNQENHLDLDGAPWGPMRIVYLQYASDPIVFFSPSLLWQPPDWLDPPRGPDVSPLVRWVPLVTGLQVAADTAVSLNVPPGFGHLYAAGDYIDGWVAVTEPEGWDAPALARLKAHFER
jgi:uncharacterized membrane protein